MPHDPATADGAASPVVRAAASGLPAAAAGALTAHYRDVTLVDVPGGPVAVVRKGTGPPVLLLHGIPLSSFTWRHNIDHLARRFTVHAVDLRGFGLSAKPAAADYSLPGHAQVVADLLDALGLPTTAVVASSFGSAVALTLADVRPDRVGSLVLINPVCYPGGRHSAARLARIGLVSALAGPVLRSRALGRRAMGSRLRHSYALAEQATDDVLDVYHRPLAADPRCARAYLATLRRLDETELAARVGRLRQPVLLIWGEQDRVLPVSDAQRFLADAAATTFAPLPHVGHLPQEEAPDLVNRLVTTFLRPVRTGAAAPEPLSPKETP